MPLYLFKYFYESVLKNSVLVFPLLCSTALPGGEGREKNTSYDRTGWNDCLCSAHDYFS